ncbi:hypothetical protein BK138_30260 [Paenibacillus rhizosphaerae]|uniref:Uncharacterized protein n=1 Tax=Paenibacillus rhizosphaerae TaxID=297318 RepID=A0A1R1ECD1_9BACL|nr:hypothetical protein BK138_30260 [Paenibacillus rhizosphaerae]
MHIQMKCSSLAAGANTTAGGLLYYVDLLESEIWERASYYPPLMDKACITLYTGPIIELWHGIAYNFNMVQSAASLRERARWET